MTFLKPDRRGISVLYVSLSRAFVVILGAVSRFRLYLFIGDEKSPQKRIPPLSGLGHSFSKEDLFQLNQNLF